MIAIGQDNRAYSGNRSSITFVECGGPVVRQASLYSDALLQPAKPVLKWAGGKTQLLPTLMQVMPAAFGDYFEPFLGGGALFFRLALPGATAADSNHELVQFYEIVRDDPAELLNIVAQWPISGEYYYHLRSLEPESLDPLTRAARFVYLNKTCYNGLHRVNKQGRFNTPFGGKTDVKILDEANLYRASAVLRRTGVRCADYHEVLAVARPGDFVYLDPPYMPLGGYSDFRRYTRHFFGEEDHAELARTFRALAERGVKALLSNSATERIGQLYDGFPIREVKASRQVNCKPEGRGQITELLIANYPLE